MRSRLLHVEGTTHASQGHADEHQGACAFTYTVSFIPRGRPRDVATRPPDGDTDLVCHLPTDTHLGRSRRRAAMAKLPLDPGRPTPPALRSCNTPQTPNLMLPERRVSVFPDRCCTNSQTGESDTRECFRSGNPKCWVAPRWAERTRKYRGFFPRL